MSHELANQPKTYSPNPPPADPFLNEVRRVIRLKHMSPRTEESYLYYIRDYFRFHNKRHRWRWAAPKLSRFSRISRSKKGSLPPHKTRRSPPSYKSSGRRPVCLAMRTSIRGPISSLAWNANTKSGQPSLERIRWEPDCLLILQPIRKSAARSLRARVLDHLLMQR